MKLIIECKFLRRLSSSSFEMLLKTDDYESFQFMNPPQKDFIQTSSTAIRLCSGAVGMNLQY
jgi:hypothetical protein